ncbi:MAG: hypothetical protein NC340_02795 [Ruminococcus flavefaciens]|nr:hypothetical protein [Ruminococcus flavefaciens]MCM1229429.1 hypothetical protein [Ruminococcus flavefaciens]
MDDFSIIIMFVLGIYLVAQIMKSPETPPEPKPDPDKKTQEKIALKILLKKTTPEEVAEKDGYDIEHIKQWMQDFIDYAVKYTADAAKNNSHVDYLIDNIAILKEICREYIGDDWEEKTGYTERSRRKYK